MLYKDADKYLKCVYMKGIHLCICLPSYGKGRSVPDAPNNHTRVSVTPVRIYTFF